MKNQLLKNLISDDELYDGEMITFPHLLSG